MLGLNRAFNGNPNAYPAGAVPGFDPSHIALAGGGACRLSAVSVYTSPAAGNNTFPMLPLAPSSQITQTPAVAAKVFLDGIIGPTVQDNTSTGGVSFTVASTTDTAMTWAGIISTNATATAYQTIVASTTGNAGLYISNANPNLYCSADHKFTNITLAANTPYFIAASGNNNGTVYGLAKNLLTGVIQTDSVAMGAHTWVATGTGIATIDDGFGDVLTGNGVACIAVTNGFLGPKGLLVWAEDPWGFWYPEPVFDFPLVGTASGPVPPYGWYNSFTQPKPVLQFPPTELNRALPSIALPPAPPYGWYTKFDQPKPVLKFPPTELNRTLGSIAQSPAPPYGWYGSFNQPKPVLSFPPTDFSYQPEAVAAMPAPIIGWYWAFGQPKPILSFPPTDLNRPLIPIAVLPVSPFGWYFKFEPPDFGVIPTPSG